MRCLSAVNGIHRLNDSTLHWYLYFIFKYNRSRQTSCGRNNDFTDYKSIIFYMYNKFAIDWTRESIRQIEKRSFEKNAFKVLSIDNWKKKWKIYSSDSYSAMLGSYNKSFSRSKIFVLLHSSKFTSSVSPCVLRYNLKRVGFLHRCGLQMFAFFFLTYIFEILFTKMKKIDFFSKLCSRILFYDSLLSAIFRLNVTT